MLPAVAGVIEDTILPADADEIAKRADVAFCALPHAASAPIVTALRDRGLTVFDLSADFRSSRPCGLRSLVRGTQGARTPTGGRVRAGRVGGKRCREADLVAVPGCYPTASVLALAPLVQQGCIDLDTLIIDAKAAPPVPVAG